MALRGFPLWEELAPLLRGDDAHLWFDAHTHMGFNDPDGVSGSADDILQGLDQAGHHHALIFAMHEPDGYPPANDAVAAAVAASGGRLEWLCRVAPDAPGAVAELRRCLALGAAGLKLHPRSDGFVLPHPVVEELVAVCAETRRPVLFHAGRGIPKLGEQCAELARRSGTPIILAHAGISDLGHLAESATELSNLYFDTSWWNASDLLQLVATIPPSRILYASDMPYAPGLIAGFALRRCCTEVGLGEEAVASIAGAQLTRLLAGEDPLELGPPPGLDALGSRRLRPERVATFAATAVQQAFHGIDPTEPISLAVLGAQHLEGDPEGPLLALCEQLLATAIRHRELSGGDHRALVPGVIAAHIVAGTPASGVPVFPA